MSKKYMNMIIAEMETYTGIAPINNKGLKDFRKVSYTSDEELLMEKFIIKLLGNNDARKELSDSPILLKNNKMKEKFAKSFLGNYGAVIKD